MAHYLLPSYIFNMVTRICEMMPYIKNTTLSKYEILVTDKTEFLRPLKGREKFVLFMKAKQENNEWKSDLKEAIRKYEAAERLCTVTTKTKRFYLLKSKIFKA